MLCNRLLGLASLLAIGLNQDIWAGEGGGSNYTPGFYGDFAMAAFSETGTFFYNFFAAYQDTASASGTLLEMPGLLHVSDLEVLGGRYIAGAFPSLMAGELNNGATSFDRVSLGDFYFLPGGINWDLGDVKLFAFEGVVAPTGRYRQGDFNLGRNYWTLDHNLLLTWSLPADNELSLSVGYMNNFENSATRYQSGDEFHFDYNLGHYFGPLGIGVTGSYYRQVTADKASADSLVPESGEATSIGPALIYTSRVNNKDAAVALKWMHELSASGRENQDYLICRLLIGF